MFGRVDRFSPAAAVIILSWVFTIGWIVKDKSFSSARCVFAANLSIPHRAPDIGGITGLPRQLLIQDSLRGGTIADIVIVEIQRRFSLEGIKRIGEVFICVRIHTHRGIGAVIAQTVQCDFGCAYVFDCRRRHSRAPFRPNFRHKKTAFTRGRWGATGRKSGINSIWNIVLFERKSQAFIALYGILWPQHRFRAILCAKMAALYVSPI